MALTLTLRMITGRTPLHYAMERRNGADNARWLLMRGAAPQRGQVRRIRPPQPREHEFPHPHRRSTPRPVASASSSAPAANPASTRHRAQHRVAADPFLSHHLGTFLILHPADSPLSTSERIAMHRVFANHGPPWGAGRRGLRGVGLAARARTRARAHQPLDAKEDDIYSFCSSAHGDLTQLTKPTW